ncbi:MAG: hypothetical protein K0S32_4177 [Bacteroidetes bacterium]|nr:hypothetical protein [Bacteroidota bacterium]
MKKIVLSTVAIMFCSTAFFAQVKQERQVSGFNKLESTSAIKVFLTIGDKEGVTFEAEEDVISKLKAEVKNGELKLYLEGKVNSNNDIIARVTAKSIIAIEASGASMVDVVTPLSTDKMVLEASGAAGIELELTTKEVVANVNGAGSIEIKGSTKELKAVATGAGRLKAAELKSEDVIVSASGAGSASVNAKTSLKADASGAGCVKYSGEPKDKKINVSVSGSVNKA